VAVWLAAVDPQADGVSDEEGESIFAGGAGKSLLLQYKHGDGRATVRLFLIALTRK